MTVTVYSKPNCPQCDATAKRMENLGIAFEKIDVTQSQESFDKLVALGHRRMPVVMVGEKSWSGFRPDLISNLV
tara:strand:- start:1426 stop:1647 length:222 start_codon:yes stop_codon:yes gene_type:complete